MGDPECQTILPKLKSDLAEILFACCDGKLKDIKIEWLKKPMYCFMLQRIS